MIHHDQSSWFIMMIRDESWWFNMMDHHDASWWVTTIHHHESGCAIIKSSRFIMMTRHDESSWFILMNHYDSAFWNTVRPWKDSFQGVMALFCHGCHGCHNMSPRRLLPWSSFCNGSHGVFHSCLPWLSWHVSMPPWSLTISRAQGPSLITPRPN